MKRQYEMVKTGHKPGWERYNIVSAGFTNNSGGDSPVSTEYRQDSHIDFDSVGDELDNVTTMVVACNGVDYNYVPWGDRDDMPLMLRKLIGDTMITSQGMAFDITCCYGQGIRFVNRDEKKKDTDDPEIRKFCLENSIHDCFMEQATDMKYYFMTVTEIVLSRDASKIVNIKNLDVVFCRLEKANNGKINHVFYGDFGRQTPPQNAVAIPLLDPINPLGDLETRLGKRPLSDTGQVNPRPDKNRKFAILTRFPTPGCRYYPIPYYVSMFKDNWYDIYRLIGIGKKYMIKNTSAPRMQIEVNEDYWRGICQNEGITDPQKIKARIDEEKQHLIDFVCGPENAGKAMISSIRHDPNGNDISMVKFVPIATAKKEGGDWSEDMSEASNALSYDLGVHPNLVGATPGKSQMNNSGSDKRELFTLKQALEKPYHDIMAKPYHVILHYNKWAEKCTVDVPMIELTKLDQNTSQQKVSINNQDDNNNKEDKDD